MQIGWWWLSGIRLSKLDQLLDRFWHVPAGCGNVLIAHGCIASRCICYWTGPAMCHAYRWVVCCLWIVLLHHSARSVKPSFVCSRVCGVIVSPMATVFMLVESAFRLLWSDMTYFTSLHWSSRVHHKKKNKHHYAMLQLYLNNKYNSNWHRALTQTFCQLKFGQRRRDGWQLLHV